MGTWMLRLALLVVAVWVILAMARAYRALDVEAIGAAFANLLWWQTIVLLIVLLVRQVLNAAPLSIYIPGVSLWRATVNDLAASTASAFAPPPSDMALRVALFTSWGYGVDVSMAGTTMNAMNLFIVRFGTPLVGFVLLPFTGRAPGLRLLDLGSLLVCAALVAGVLLVVRSGTRAAVLGRRLGRVARRFRASITPDAWADGFQHFQQHIASGFSWKFPRAIVCTLAMVAVDLVLLVLALRFVGVASTEASLLIVAAAFVFAYPLTLFPMQGIGIMDTAILATLVGVAGPEVASPAVAGLIIWRVYTVGGPLLLGVVAIAFRRRVAPSART